MPPSVGIRQTSRFGINEIAARRTFPANSTTMQTQSHPLIAPTLGTARNLTSFHYGPGGGQKIYIQSSLHADELPGMLVSWELRRKLAALEAACKMVSMAVRSGAWISLTSSVWCNRTAVPVPI